MERYTLTTKNLFLTSIFLLLLSTSTLSAQETEYFTISLDLLTDLPSSTSHPTEKSKPLVSEKTERFFTMSADEDEFTPKGSIEAVEEIPSYFRHHKQLPEKFSGYVIELLQSDVKLNRDYPLFNRFGNVHVKQLANGKYSYCIIADFNRFKSVKIFAEKVILPVAPDAQALIYKKGKRKKK